MKAITTDNLKQIFSADFLLYHYLILPIKEDQGNSFAIKINSLQNVLEKCSFVKHV